MKSVTTLRKILKCVLNRAKCRSFKWTKFHDVLLYCQHLGKQIWTSLHLDHSPGIPNRLPPQNQRFPVMSHKSQLTIANGSTGGHADKDEHATRDDTQALLQSSVSSTAMSGWLPLQGRGMALYTHILTWRRKPPAAPSDWSTTDARLTRQGQTTIDLTAVVSSFSRHCSCLLQEAPALMLTGFNQKDEQSSLGRGTNVLYLHFRRRRIS